MAGFEDVTNLNLGAGNVAIGIVSTLFYVVMILVLVSVVGVLMYLLWRWLNYSTSVEFYEIKGNELSFYGDDRARRVEKNGVTHISFLANKTKLFKNRQWPDSKYLIKKKIWGTKIKYVISGDEIYPVTLKADAKKLSINEFPTYMKIDYLQRMERIDEDYKSNSNRGIIASYVIGAGLMLVMLFAFFTIWQSNVATAESNRAVASAIGSSIDRLAGLLGNTVPEAP